jgi:hypothetical protein
MKGAGLKISPIHDLEVSKEMISLNMGLVLIVRMDTVILTYSEGGRNVLKMDTKRFIFGILTHPPPLLPPSCGFFLWPWFQFCEWI